MGILATSMINASGLACCSADSGASRSQTITSASLMASSPATVSRPGSPGPPPTKITDPAPVDRSTVAGSGRHSRHTMITSCRRDHLITFSDAGGRYYECGVPEVFGCRWAAAQDQQPSRREVGDDRSNLGRDDRHHGT